MKWTESRFAGCKTPQTGLPSLCEGGAGHGLFQKFPEKLRLRTVELAMPMGPLFRVPVFSKPIIPLASFFPPAYVQF